MFFIGGFHRSGSMLLGSILCQNKNIHMEGKSALCQLMWDAKNSVNESENFLIANGRNHFDKDFISEIPKIYYKNNNRNIVIDKNPWWTNINNINLIYNYIDKEFKMIVLYRNPIEIIKSFTRIYLKNNIALETPLINNFPEVFDNYDDFVFLLNNNYDDHFLFIDYEDLVNNTYEKILKIYNFLEIDYFDHDLKNIKQYYLSSNSFLNLDGLYEVNYKIKKGKYNIELDEISYEICSSMNNEIISYKELGLC